MKVIAKNPRSRFDYALEDTLLAGIVLTGPEVKSVRGGKVNLKGSYVKLNTDSAEVINMHIAPYPFAVNQPHEETRTRKLLLTQKQLDDLNARKNQGRHVVPTALGVQGKFIKLEIGIGTSKKRRDKRETIKQRQSSRESARIIKNKTVG